MDYATKNKNYKLLVAKFEACIIEVIGVLFLINLSNAKFITVKDYLL